MGLVRPDKRPSECAAVHVFVGADSGRGRVRGDLELVFGQGLTNSRLLPDPDMLKYTFGHFQY